MIPNGAQSPGGTARTPSPARDAVDAYGQTGDLTALERGIRFTRAALRQAMTVSAGDLAHAGEQVALRIDLDRTPAGSPQRPDRLAALATVLHDGHEEFSTGTADEALALSA